MSVRSMIEKGSLRAFGKVLAVWGAAAAVLCIAAACVVHMAGIPSAQLGYLSSALSFLTALIAGAAGTRTAGKTGGALLCAAGLSLTLLTAGCLIGGKIQEPSGVLSAASFSFAGCLMGSLMFGRKNAETNRSSFRTKRIQIRKG